MPVQQLNAMVATYSHSGRRLANQDAVEVRRLSTGAELIAVADGMGGHAAGEVASATALEVLVEELERGATLFEAFSAANQAVYNRSRERTEWKGMGTTLVALLRDESGYSVSNVGDSRAYRIGNATIEQITSDHSFVAEAVLRGAMTEEQAESSPWRNALTRAVGTDAEVEVDVFGPFPPAPAHAVLLCSDGLYKSVSDEVIREYVLSTADLTTATEALAALAYRQGSDDNISIALIEFDTLTRRTPIVTLPVAIQVQSDSAQVPTDSGGAATTQSAEQSLRSRVANAGRRTVLGGPRTRRRRRPAWLLVLVGVVALVMVMAGVWALFSP